MKCLQKFFYIFRFTKFLFEKRLSYKSFFIYTQEKKLIESKFTANLCALLDQINR